MEELSAHQRDLLDFEAGLILGAGAKEQAIRARFGLSATSYYQQLNMLLDTQAARILQATAVDDDAAPAAAVLRALPAVDSTVWRAGLSHGLRRRLTLFEPLGTDTSTAEQAHQALLLRTRVMLAAVECDDPRLRPILADLAPSWTGTVDNLMSTGRAALGA